jgi:hypothetical protein
LCDYRSTAEIAVVSEKGHIFGGRTVWLPFNYQIFLRTIIMAITLSNFQSPADFSERLAIAPKVRSPRANEDVRCREEWCWADVMLIKHESKIYLVKSNLSQALAGLMFRGSLFAAASDKAEIFIWPVKLIAPTAVEAAKAACKKWSRIVWNHASKSYQVKDPEKQHADPNWRFENFDQLIESAFSGRILDSTEQEVVQEILGHK